MRTLTGHRHAVRAVAYAPGPVLLLASTGDDRSIRLWDPVLGQEVAYLENRRDGLLCLAFAPDGSRLAAGGRAGSITVWDVQTRVRDPGTSLSVGPVIALAFTREGRAVLAGLRSQRYGGEPGRLLCWNLHPPHPLESLDWEGDVESVAINPARDLLAIAGQYRGVELWEVGRPRREPVFWMPSRVRGVCFSPGDGRLLAVAGGRVVQVWDVEEGRWTVSCEGHRGEVQALAFAPDGRLLISAGMDRTVRLWETSTGRQLASWDWQIGAVNSVAFSPDGMTAAAGGEKPQVVVWDVDDG
jgi:WD40 repeat protein